MSFNEFTPIFGGFDLSTIPNVKFSRRQPFDLPNRQLKQGQLARAHGKKILSTFFGDKPIPMEGYIDATDRTAMEIARDVLLFRLLPQEANLDLQVAGATRTFVATMENIVFSHIEGGKMTFTISFKCSNPFGKDTSQTSLAFTNPRTVTTFDTAITIGGSFTAEIILAIALASGTGFTSKTITISNPQTGEFISVTRTWLANDTLVIDVPNKQVTVNGSVVDYNGVFPLFSPGSATIRYTDNFTTRSVSLSGSYYKRYL